MWIRFRYAKAFVESHWNVEKKVSNCLFCKRPKMMSCGFRKPSRMPSQMSSRTMPGMSVIDFDEVPVWSDDEKCALSRIGQL